MDKLSTLSSGLNSGILPRIDVPKWKEEQRTKVRLRLNGRRCETANPTPELLWWGLGRIGSLSWSWSLSLSMSLGSSFGGGARSFPAAHARGLPGRQAQTAVRFGRIKVKELRERPYFALVRPPALQSDAQDHYRPRAAQTNPSFVRQHLPYLYLLP